MKFPVRIKEIHKVENKIVSELGFLVMETGTITLSTYHKNFLSGMLIYYW